MEVIKAIKTRHSIRHYQSAPVDENTLEIVLDAARWAPSWGNTQCWRFIVIKNSETKARLAEILINNPATDAVKTAPLVIVICAELKKAGFYRGETCTDKGEYWYMFDTALAMHNLSLASHSLGLGTVHVGRFDAGKAAEILNVPPGFTVVEMTPLGYPDGEPSLTTRKELSEIVYHEKFGAADKP